MVNQDRGTHSRCYGLKNVFFFFFFLKLGKTCSSCVVWGKYKGKLHMPARPLSQSTQAVLFVWFHNGRIMNVLCNVEHRLRNLPVMFPMAASAPSSWSAAVLLANVSGKLVPKATTVIPAIDAFSPITQLKRFANCQHKKPQERLHPKEISHLWQHMKSKHDTMEHQEGFIPGCEAAYLFHQSCANSNCYQWDNERWPGTEDRPAFINWTCFR